MSDEGARDPALVSSGEQHGRSPSPLTNSGTRLPFHPRSVRFADESQNALAVRVRYYNRLDPGGNSSLLMPDHVVPAHFFSVVPFVKAETKQSSIVTIFSVWNTMVGTSLLSLPWALNQAGFALGLALIFLMAAICFYTAIRVVESPRRLLLENNDAMVEFSDVCRYHYGKWGERIAVLFSTATLLGAAVVYWVLMSNFLFFTGEAVYDSVTEQSGMSMIKNDSLQCDILCVDSSEKLVSFVAPVSNGTTDLFHRFWHIQNTVPLYLVLLVFPLLNLKSPTFFTKFNGLGTVSIIYLIAFVSIKASECGFNIQFSDSTKPAYVPLVESKFLALSGILSLSFFIHNCILSILRNQKNPENNVRDLSIAYGFVTVTYILVAVVFYAMFPLVKSCISDNLLNNFGGLDLFSSIARFFLLFQMITVYPLLLFIVRVQLFSWLFDSSYPSFLHVVSLNVGILTLCVLMAVFVPKVGKIIGFTGAFSGLAFVFTLPCMVYLAEEYLRGRLTKTKCCIHVVLILLGCFNFIGQFFI